MKFEYLSKIHDLLNIIEHSENENMEKTVNVICEAIENKKSIYIFGASHAGILAQELYYRAGGLVLINPILPKSLMLDTSPITLTSKMEQLVGYGDVIASTIPFKPGDVLIVHSVSGRNAVGIEMAMSAKAKGVTIVGLTNVSYSKDVTSRHPSKKRLFEISDIVLDNHGEKGDACVCVNDDGLKVSPTSTVIGASILNSIMAEVVKKLIVDGMIVPPVFYSANIDGGAEKNKIVIDEFGDSIHYSY